MEEFDEPEMLDVLFGALEDPRINRSKLYSLKELFFLALAGTVAGVKSWRGFELFGNERLELLREYLPFEHGIPTHQTIGRVFSLVKPRAFEESFGAFMASIQKSSEGEIIAIDGKSVRGARRKDGKAPLHLLNAWAVKNGLTLAQREVGEKENEIVALPEILKSLNLKGAVVTVDALNCQKEAAKEIVNGGADYVMALKLNHPTLHTAVREQFEQHPIPEDDIHYFETTDKGHGRIEHRRYYSITAGEWLPQTKEWTGLKSVGMVVSDVFRGEKPSSEIRFFISSLPANAKKFAESVRGHWGIENSLHWVLDVTFSEDASQVRKDHAPQNYATIRKLAHNILKLNKDKGSLVGKKMRALMKPNYLRNLLRQAGI